MRSSPGPQRHRRAGGSPRTSDEHAPVRPVGPGQCERPQPRALARGGGDRRVRRLRVPELQAGRAGGEAPPAALRRPRTPRVAPFPAGGSASACAAAALAAEVAGGQGKFWPMHDLLFDNQRHLKPAQLRSYGERLELDMLRYDADMADTVYLQRVREDIESGRASGVRATPTFYVNGAIQDV